MWRWLALIWAVVSVGTVLWFVRLGRLRIKYAFPTMALGLLVGALAAAPALAEQAARRLHLETPLALVTLLVLAYSSGMSLVAVRELSRPRPASGRWPRRWRCSTPAPTGCRISGPPPTRHPHLHRRTRPHGT